MPDELSDLAAALAPPQYGTGLHWPYCIDGQCSGCIPDRPAPPERTPAFDPSIFGSTAHRSEADRG